MKAQASSRNKDEKQSHRPSISGGLLSVLALLFSGFGTLIVNLDVKSDRTDTSVANTVGTAVANGTLGALTTVISAPFLFIGITLGILAIVLTLARLRKVKLTGLLFSILWIVLSVWAIRIGVATFSLIKAN